MKWEDTKLAYYAGLFDGEGCIHIDKVNKGDRFNYTLRCKMSIIGLDALRQLQFDFGGSLTKDKFHSKGNRANAIWTWVVWSQNSVNFLNAIMPYAGLKKKEAILAIEFQCGKQTRGAKGGHWGNGRKTTEALAKEDSQYILMRNLKRRAKGYEDLA